MASNSKYMQSLQKKKKLNFFRAVQAELKKVSWTTKEEIITFTKIILGATFVFALAIYFADLIVRSTLNFISLISKLIIG